MGRISTPPILTGRSHRLQVLRWRRRWSPGRGGCDIAIAEETFASARIAVSAAGSTRNIPSADASDISGWYTPRMAAKKRTKNRKANAMRSAGNNVTPMKQKVKKKLVKKKIARKKSAREGAAVKA
jgi:hypothetical protein